MSAVGQRPGGESGRIHASDASTGRLTKSMKGRHRHQRRTCDNGLFVRKYLEAKMVLQRWVAPEGLSAKELRRRMHETTTPLIEEWERCNSSGSRDQSFRQAIGTLIDTMVLKLIKGQGVRLGPKTKFVKARVKRVA